MCLEGQEMGSLVMGIAQDLLSFDFSDTLANSPRQTRLARS